ncbi:MAG: dihydroorotase [Planctomycetes bacterium]|nr:dihydroorotase [Planctomycetota bacterium]
MSTLLIRNGRVIDPASGLDGPANVFVRDGKIESVGKATPKAAEAFDAKGLVVCPGLIDMHVHLREPGKEEEETIASGAAAAVAGGFTSVAAMPNTEPACDSEAQVEFTLLQGRRAGMAHVYPIGAVTRGRKGAELAEIGQMHRGGAVAFSDDGTPVHNAALMRLALEYARMFDRAVIQHSEDPNLFCGCMHEGRVSMELGLEGIPAVCEESMIGRDIMLARMTGGHLHAAHISTRGSAELIRRGKADGVRVTAEVTPHHFTLTDDRIRSYDPVFKMNPPLREGPDVQAMIDGLRDGTIDAIACDHAPHAPEEKEVEFAEAPFGVIGLETTLALVMTYLVGPGHLTLAQAIEKMTINPAKILRLPKGTLAPGADADVTIFDPKKKWKVDIHKFRSRSRNCPFHGWELRGKAVKVVVGGRLLDCTTAPA